MKSIFTFIFIFLISTFSISAQIDDEGYYFNEVIDDAVFETGMDNFYKIVTKNLRSVDDTVGRVFVQFVVDTTGKTSEFKIVKGISERSDKEVLRLMEWMSEHYKWKSRVFRGQKVKTKMCIPINFYLNKQKQSNDEKIYRK